MSESYCVGIDKSADNADTTVVVRITLDTDDSVEIVKSLLSAHKQEILAQSIIKGLVISVAYPRLIRPIPFPYPRLIRPIPFPYPRQPSVSIPYDLDRLFKQALTAQSFESVAQEIEKVNENCHKIRKEKPYFRKNERY